MGNCNTNRLPAQPERQFAPLETEEGAIPSEEQRAAARKAATEGQAAETIMQLRAQNAMLRWRIARQQQQLEGNGTADIGPNGSGFDDAEGSISLHGEVAEAQATPKSTSVPAPAPAELPTQVAAIAQGSEPGDDGGEGDVDGEVAGAVEEAEAEELAFSAMPQKSASPTQEEQEWKQENAEEEGDRQKVDQRDASRSTPFDEASSVDTDVAVEPFSPVSGEAPAPRAAAAAETSVPHAVEGRQQSPRLPMTRPLPTLLGSRFGEAAGNGDVPSPSKKGRAGGTRLNIELDDLRPAPGDELPAPLTQRNDPDQFPRTIGGSDGPILQCMGLRNLGSNGWSGITRCAGIGRAK